MPPNPEKPEKCGFGTRQQLFIIFWIALKTCNSGSSCIACVPEMIAAERSHGLNLTSTRWSGCLQTPLSVACTRCGGNEPLPWKFDSIHSRGGCARRQLSMPKSCISQMTLWDKGCQEATLGEHMKPPDKCCAGGVLGRPSCRFGLRCEGQQATSSAVYIFSHKVRCWQ